jgi:hypothetical protein
MRRLLVLILATPLTAYVLPVHGAPLFEAEAPLVATLTGPLTRVYRDARLDEPEYLPAKWVYQDIDGNAVTLDVRIRTRGKSRREVCTFPPLMLNFDKGALDGTHFDGQNKLKLVGPCKPSKSYQQQLVLEWLAYRALELLTPNSFDTRLVRLTYVDTNRKNRSWEHTTFLIEDEKDMAKRNGYKLLETPKLARQRLDPYASALVELFQLMIGNTDYSTIRGPAGSSCCHNVKLMVDEAGTVVPVPYDFDSSGLVDAPYALPPEVVPISDVRKRYFTGICKSSDDWQRAIGRFLTLEPDIVRLFAEEPRLDRRTRSRNVEYIEDFFEILHNPERVQREILDRCRGPKPEDDE